MKNYLSEIVGQKSVKAKLNFYLDSYQQTRLVPNFLLQGQKGSGKSMIARHIARNLPVLDESGKPVEVTDPKDGKVKIKKKTFIEINCSSIKSLVSWIESVYVTYINGRDVCVLFDESSELPNDLQMALLTMLNPTKENKTTFCYRDFIVETDFFRHNYIFCTTHGQKMNNALRDRLTPIDIAPYTNNELGIILQQNLPDVEFENGLLDEISSFLRGNPRSAVLLATRDIYAYLKGKKKFSFGNWKDFIELLGLAPLGLTELEISILKLLKDNPGGTSLTALSSRTGLDRSALQKIHESWLVRCNLMEIKELSHRSITGRGLDYLKGLKA